MSRFYISLTAAILIAAGCVCLIPKINVNSDMTKYLPDSSQMRAGLETMNSEFDLSAMQVADVRVMMPFVSDEDTETKCGEMSAMAGVDTVSIRQKDGKVLYELVVAKSVDQQKLAKSIKEEFGEGTVTQTSQDGNTPDPMALIVALIALVVILFITSKSWLEPVLFLVTTGMAVAVNIGTNAFLDSVSVTTTSIVGVLQLVLSMDYSIILMNRFRSVMETETDRKAGMMTALKKASPAILSSSFTTMVGLIMLAFMRLKIGKDLGFVLAKGVLCSLIYVYTALPGLILLCYKGIEATRKPVLLIPTAGLAKFGHKFKYPLTALFIVIFGVSFYFQRQTPMHFHTTLASPIDDVFPKSNNIVLLYDNADEDSIVPIIDKFGKLDCVQTAISYPSLMKTQKTVAQMKDMLQGLAPDQAGALTDEMMRIIYFGAHTDNAKDLKITMPELMKFLRQEAADTNSLIAGKLDVSMKDKLTLLDAFDGMDTKQSAKPVKKTIPIRIKPKAETAPASASQETAEKAAELPVAAAGEETAAAVKDTLTTATPAVPDSTMTLHEYAQLLYERVKNEETADLLALSDEGRITTEMTVAQMSVFMGSSVSQTKMVYSFSKNARGTMTPLEFSSFLVNDLFKRKALSAFVSADQKAAMRARLSIMECAVSGERLGEEKLKTYAQSLGIEGDIDLPKDNVQEPATNETAVATTTAEQTQNAENQQSSVPAVKDTTVAKAAEQKIEKTAEPAAAPAKKPAASKPTKAERQANLMMNLMGSKKGFTSTEMAKNFSRLGEKINPELVSLLYNYYGAKKCFDDSWTLSLEEFVGYITDNILDNPQFSEYIDQATRDSFASIPSQTSQLKGPSHSIALLVTDLPDESEKTETFIHELSDDCNAKLASDHSLIGESVMFCEMKDGFSRELLLVTILTIAAIFIIVAITFRSPLTALVLVMTVMSAVFINVAVSGIGGRSMLYLADLIVQSILMGATIDYGILFATQFRQTGSLTAAYKDSIQTITTSGLIIILVPGLMALFLDDAMIRPIVGSLAIGSLSAVAMILLVMPGVLAALDRIINRKHR